MMNFYYGVVEDRTTDPLKLGRCKVRVVGLHTEDKTILPTEDLPWATIMQPAISAAMSGIGHSPLGPVEGTWVIVVFGDEFKQSPIIIGTVGGIPSPLQPILVEERIPLTDSSGNEVKDSSGNTVYSNETRTVDKTNEVQETNSALKPTSVSLSAKGISALKKHEGLASLAPNKTRLGKDSTPDSTTIYSYRDTRGIWTIGWGSIYMPDGSSVGESSTITKAQADSLLATRLSNEFEPGVKRMVKVPITQSMYDALVSLAYNMGVGGLRSTKIISLLNSGDYKAAAAIIPSTKNNGGTLTRRRTDEQSLFVADGFPTLDGDIEPSPQQQEAAAQEDKTQNPVILKKENGTQKITYETVQRKSEGFRDPNKVYPKWMNEPDTHRLARGEGVDRTIVFAKEAARAKSVSTADGASWNQPPVPYNAKYPFNHVFSSESGHVDEWDDTPGNERRHSWHKAGTFTEIDVNGTTVNRIVGDSYEILERNGYVVIRGNCNVTIEGNHNVRVENDAKIQVLGNADLSVTGNLKTGVGGDFLVKCGGNFSVDATRIDLNGGASGGVTVPSEGASGAKEFGALRTPSRNQELNASYETPEEGDNTAVVEEQVKSGRVDPDDVQPQTEKVEEAPVETSKSEPVITECNFNTTEFTRGMQITDLYTLGGLCVGNSGIPTGINYGLKPEEIICNLKQLAVNCLEPIKRKYPNMVLTSTWRSEAVNTRSGGSKKSDHLFGYAADLQLSGFSREEHYKAIQEIAKLVPAFRQLILEYKGSTTWIHISFNKNDNKMQCLTIDAARNKTLASGKFILYA